MNLNPVLDLFPCKLVRSFVLHNTLLFGLVVSSATIGHPWHELWETGTSAVQPYY